jgi:hypothetical protein
MDGHGQLRGQEKQEHVPERAKNQASERKKNGWNPLKKVSVKKREAVNRDLVRVHS